MGRQKFSKEFKAKVAPDVFGRKKDWDAEKAKEERDRLYKKVGQLQIEVDWHSRYVLSW